MRIGVLAEIVVLTDSELMVVPNVGLLTEAELMVVPRGGLLTEAEVVATAELEAAVELDEAAVTEDTTVSSYGTHPGRLKFGPVLPEPPYTMQLYTCQMSKG